LQIIVNKISAGVIDKVIPVNVMMVSLMIVSMTGANHVYFSVSHVKNPKKIAYNA
jgi:hypothetical protein